MAYIDQHRWRKAAISLSLSMVIGLFAYDMRTSLGNTTANVVGAVALVAFAYGIYKVVFGDGHSFGDAIVYVLTPDLLSSITNERKADEISSFKLCLWVSAIAAVGYFYFRALLT